MTRYEYKVVPAPTKGLKDKTVKTPEGRFALGVETVLNRMGAEGWEFQRAELLPSDERSGLTGSAQHWRNLLVFRRRVAESAEIAASEPPAAEPASRKALEDNGVEEAGGVTDLPSALRSRAAQQLTLVPGDKDGPDDGRA